VKNWEKEPPKMLQGPISAFVKMSKTVKNA
jgi:hypothetical protein